MNFVLRSWTPLIDLREQVVLKGQPVITKGGAHRRVLFFQVLTDPTGSRL